jgi:type VI protein secretion system component VasF
MGISSAPVRAYGQLTFGGIYRAAENGQRSAGDRRSRLYDQVGAGARDPSPEISGVKFGSTPSSAMP